MNDQIPTESAEQKLLFEWAAYQGGRYPALSLLLHIPNGGARRKSEAARMSAEGVRAGVPDLCLPVARGGYHGLFIELKRTRGGRVSPEQTRWIRNLNDQGYYAAVCIGWENASQLLLAYLRGEVMRS